MLIFIIVLLALILYVLWENENPYLERIYIDKGLLEKELRIIHISDLHSHSFGRGQEKLRKVLKDEQFDLVLLTGDLIDRRKPRLGPITDLLDIFKAKRLFFIRGNHEKLEGGFYQSLRKELSDRGVCILENQNFLYRHEGQEINIMGISDPREYIGNKRDRSVDEGGLLEKRLKVLKEESQSHINILLVHRPEYFKTYVENEIDYVFTGHSHGGQVRILRRGLLSPDQGFFGKYAGGIFEEAKTSMINCRGLGNNFFFAKRVFNRPHILKVTIK